jgi:hypothetical protein
MNRGAVVAAAAFMITTLVPTLASAETHPQTRQGWLVGFAVGGGSAGISVPGVSTERTGGGAGSLRVGYAFQPQISLELDSGGWTREEDGVTTTFSVGGVGLNYYPGAQGFVLRGALGYGNADVSISSGSTTTSASESGFGFLVGTGYEFRVRRTFAIGPEVEYGWTTLSGFDANFVNLNLGFNWYFIPK